MEEKELSVVARSFICEFGDTAVMTTTVSNRKQKKQM
jgi:hypothetical protein